jgi:HSP20 family protein
VGKNKAWPDNSLSIYPLVDIEETENDFRILAEIPGVDKGDIKINVENNILSFSGEKKMDKETKDENYCRFERQFGKFHRRFEFPVPVNWEKIVAEYKNGILSIQIPKSEDAKPKLIDIKVE